MTQHRRVLLIRHAEAGPTPPGSSDHGRPLTERGRRQAALIGRLAAAAGAPPELVYLSDAVRTVETWTLAAQAGGLSPVTRPDRALYGAEVEDLIDLVATTPEQVSTIAVVGHAPEIPSLAFGLHSALAEPAHGWPAGCVGVAEWDGAWSDLAERGALVGYFLTDEV